MYNKMHNKNYSTLNKDYPKRVVPSKARQMFGIVIYTIRKKWFGLVSTTCLRRIPFIKKKRIIYFKETKELLYTLQDYFDSLKKNNISSPSYYVYNGEHRYKKLSTRTPEGDINNLPKRDIDTLNDKKEH